MDIEYIILTSVAPNLNNIVCEELFYFTKSVPIILDNEYFKSIKFNFESYAEKQIGTDRLVVSYYASKMYELPAVIIDFGTAITLNIIGCSGEFLGGAIIPGVRISLDSMTSRTSQLPKISLEAPRHTIGKNTIECIKSGAIYANNINISSDAGNIIFSGNTSESYGGALYSTNDVSIASDSGSITFSGNSSANRGGAIYTNKNINITSNSGKITFSDNSSQQKGGAIYTNGGQIISTSGEINFSNNSSDHAATIVREGDYFYACFEYRVNVPETQSLTALMEDCEGLDRGVVIPIQLSDGTKYATELKERTGVSPIALAIT